MLNKHYKQKAAQLFTRAGISMKPETCTNCDTQLKWVDSNGIDWETWACKKCDAVFEVPTEIMRFWDKGIQLDEDDK